MDRSITLPEEIIEVILSKCPVKSVFRFKAVSKSWESTISNPRLLRILQSKLSENQNKFFIWDCLQYPLGNPSYLIRLEEDGKFERESVSGYPSFEFVPLFSCNGLILLGAEPDKYMLWNPFIKKHIMIPAFSPETHPEAFRNWPGMDPHPWMHHLYFDSVNDNYKVVFVYEKCFKVYSCKNGSWGEAADIPGDLSVLECEAWADGCLYCKRNSEIVFFDARDGKLHKFLQPNDVNGLVEVELKEVSGRLCLCGLSEDRRRLQLWVMEENGSFEKSWRKLISMENEQADLCDLSPVCMSNDDLVVLSTTVPKDEEGNFKHFLYNPRENSFKEIEFTWQNSAYCFPYSETLYMPS